MGIGVLGPLTCDPPVVGRRDRAVLSALALYAGRSLRADQLAQAVWGDELPPSYRKALQGCMVRLRRVLGADRIETTTDGYLLDVPADEIDALRFERLTQRGRELVTLGEAERASSLVAQALDLWRGTAYEDVQTWDPAVIESARLDELRLEAEELRVDACLRTGRHVEILATAESMVRFAPLREARWTLLARAQYQAGNQTDALRTIRRLKSLLADQFGLDPGVELESLEEAILRQDDSLLVGAPLPTSSVCPYQGLMPYDVDDAEAFFGRSSDTLVCLDLLRRTGALTVVGPSGCGKSSLVRAGVAATLRREGRAVVVVSPGAHPMEVLAGAPGPRSGVVLVVDQCEEVFSQCEDENQRTEFLNALVRWAQGPGTIVVALRADRLAQVSAYPAFARFVERGLYLLGGMSDEALREAIEAPARQSGLLIEAGLVDLLAGEVEGTPGALPLLSHALLETWRRREGSTLTVAGYAETGGIRGAVARSAESVYTSVGPDQQHLLRDLVLRLVSSGTEGEPVRSRVPRRVLAVGAEHDHLIDLLVTSRLVTSDAGVVEIAHEALARAWPRLRTWLDEDVEGQRILRHLSASADSWDQLGRADSELYRGVRLAQALEWRARASVILTETETAFLDAAEGLEVSERRAVEGRARDQTRMIRRQRTLLAGSAALLVMALTAGVLAVRQANRADDSATAAAASAGSALDAQRSAEARRAGARALVTDDIDTSMLLAVAGVRLDASASTLANLLSVLQQRPQLARSVPSTGDPVAGMEVLPDGGGLVTYDRRGGVQLHSTTTWETLAEVERSDERIPLQWSSPLAMSPGGEVIAAAPPGVERDPLVLLDTGSLEPSELQLGDMPTGPVRVTDVDFSADGTAVAATVQRLERQDGYWFPMTTEVLVWELAENGSEWSVSMRTKLPRIGFGFQHSRVELSPDGDIAYTSRPLSAYDVENGSVIYRRSRELGSPGVRQTTSNVFDLNPTGTLLAVTESPDRLLLVDAVTGRVHRRLRGHSDQITALQFSHDGRSLASASLDRTAIIWEVRTGAARELLPLGEGALALAFSPDDASLYSGGEDRSLRAWDLEGSHRFLATNVQPGDAPTGSQVPAPNGRYISSWIGPGLRFYDVAEHRWTRWVGEDRNHLGIAWNSVGTRVATVGAGFVAIWDAATADLVDEATLDGTFAAVDFSPDDTRIALLDEEGSLSMVDAATLAPVGEPIRLGTQGGAVSFGPDGRALILTPGYLPDYTFDHVSRQWLLVDLDTGGVIDRAVLDFDAVWLGISPDGHHAAITGLRGELVLLDLDTGEPVRAAATGHTTTVWGTVYSNDGSRVVTTGLDGSISLWDGRTGDLLGSVLLPEKVTSAAGFGADGSTVMIATDLGGLYEWDTDPGHALEFACRLAGRELTEAEWRQHFGDRPWQPTCPDA